MVVVEICTYSWNPKNGEWPRLVEARITAHGESLELTGNPGGRLRDISVIDPATGDKVTSSEPERWARLLPYAFRSGQIVAEVVRDDAQRELAG